MTSECLGFSQFVFGGFFFFKQNLDNWNFFILLIQVRKPKYWTEDIQFNKVHCIGWSHSPAGGIHVCGGYSSILSSLLHFLLNVSIVTDRYDFQSISCNIQIGRCKNLILSLSLSFLSPSLSLWMNCTSCVFVLLTLFLHIYIFLFLLFIYHKIQAWDAVWPSNHFSFANHPKGHELVHCRFPTCWM